MARDRFDGDDRSPSRGAGAFPSGAARGGAPGGARAPRADAKTAAAPLGAPALLPPLPLLPARRSPVLGASGPAALNPDALDPVAPGPVMPGHRYGADPRPGPPSGVAARGRDAAPPQTVPTQAPASPPPGTAREVHRAASGRAWRGAVGLAALAVLAACADADLDLRDLGRGFDTSAAALAATEQRPRPDDRGILSYPGYQVAVARRGDTVADVAARIGLPAEELARFNGAPVDAVLNRGEVLALPRRVAEPSPATGAPTTGPIRPGGQVDVTELAGAAIERAEGTDTAEPDPAAARTGAEPVRHRVSDGETAFSIARRYGVPVAALAEWNGLGPDYTVRTGQYLLIPPKLETAAAAPAPPPPGSGTPTPTPPSAAEPLPEDEPPVAANAAEGEAGAAGPTASDLPDSPDLGAERTAASGGQARLVLPVAASIIRDFEPGETDGIDFAATPGAPVRAAATGTIGFITEDAGATRVILIRHADGLNTIYGNVKDPQVEVGDRVGRGELIATVGDAEPAVFRFEVREGVEAVDPNDYLR